MLERLTAGAKRLMRRFSPMQQMLAGRSQFLHGGTASKIAVNERTALTLAAVWACIRVKAETKASLPLQVYERTKSGRVARVSEHYVSWLLGSQPNSDQTPMVWSEFRQAQIEASGNSFTEIVYDGRGVPIALIPRDWRLVRPFRDPSGELLYELRGESGERTRILDRSEILHVPGLGNGIDGWSPIRMHAEAIGIGLGQDQSAATLLGNGVKPSIVVSTPGLLQPERKKELQEQLEANWSGSNRHRAMLLDGGITATPLAIPLNEAQFLESREYQEEVICRIYRVPPHMIGLLRRATFSNIEAQDLSFEKHTMRPCLVRDEQELNRKLFPPSQQGRFFVKHNVEALLRADIKTRSEAYKTSILGGWRTQNEIRQIEDLEPMPGGDELLRPEAIFGKSGGVGQKPEAGKKKSEGSRRKAVGRRRKAESSRQVMRALVRDVVRGLLQREITQLGRVGDDATKRAAFYEKHSAVVAEKLRPFGANGLRVGEQLLSRRAAGAVSDELLSEVEPLVDSLLLPSGWTNCDDETDDETTDEDS